MRNAGLEEAQGGIKIAGRNINNLRYADNTTLRAESEEELKSLLMKVKEESEKVGLKLNIEKTKIIASGPITSWQIDGKTVASDFIFLGSKITADGDCSNEIKRCLLLRRKLMTNLNSILKSRDITLPTSLSSQGCGFSSSHVWMWELDYKESWAWKNWCFWTVVLEKTLESPLDCKVIQPVHPKGDQSLVFIGRTDVEAETPILWPPDAKSWVIGKDPDAGKDWGQKEKGATEDEMVGWHHWLDGHGFLWTPGVGDWRGGLVCCGLLSHRESDTTEWVTALNWTDWIFEKAREFQKNIYFCLIDYDKTFNCVYHSKLWKILQKMGILDHLTCFLINLYAGQEATVRSKHETTEWLQIGKGVHQSCILSEALSQHHLLGFEIAQLEFHQLH